MRWISLALALACATLLGAASPTRAQEAVPHDNVVSANPFLLLLEWFNAEWEHRLTPTTTFAVGVSLFSFDDDEADYRSLNGAFRYYPQGNTPHGFYVGPRLGIYNVEDSSGDSETLPGFGFDVGYQWILGVDRRFSISLGLGLTRLFGSDDGVDDLDSTIPSVRLVNVGWAF